MFADYILLLFGQTPRRAKGIFNVLRGRRTVSTLFAGLTYGCLDQLDSWHGVPLETFLITTRELIEAGLLTSPTPGYVQLTTSGIARQTQLRKTLYQPTDLREFQLTDVRRFTTLNQLALQVTSYAVHQANRYYPVTTDPGLQAVVKAWFRRYRGPDLGATVRQALSDFLRTLPTPHAQVFVLGLTGYQFPGETAQQLAQAFGYQPVEIRVLRQDLACQWVTWVKANQVPPFWELLAPLVKTSPVSTSAQRTYADFLRVGDLTAIAQQRHLKLSTVREHLLEVAILSPDFPFEQLLAPAIQQRLRNIFATTPDLTNWQFSQVQAAGMALDFFEFRLYQIMRCQHDE